MAERTDSRKASGHAHGRKVDPVTGYDTTGHDWGGITELNTPFPKVVIWALALTFVYSVIAWILLPAWPTGRDYTRGLLGLDQGEAAVAGFRDLAEGREDWMSRLASEDLAALQADPAFLEIALPAARRLFADNCAVCHGDAGQGGPGFPVLADGYWLWSGEPDAIAATIRFGINAEHPDTRFAEMPSFDWMERPERAELARFVAALPKGDADFDSPAGVLFTENCAACHGDAGEGGLETGAPSLADGSVIYGQGEEAVWETLLHGRRGVMPAWSGRLSEAQIKLLALHVASLAAADGGAAR